VRRLLRAPNRNLRRPPEAGCVLLPVAAKAPPSIYLVAIVYLELTVAARTVRAWYYAL
jgi:hypothetical protein